MRSQSPDQTVARTPAASLIRPVLRSQPVAMLLDAVALATSHGTRQVELRDIVELAGLPDAEVQRLLPVLLAHGVLGADQQHERHGRTGLTNQPKPLYSLGKPNLALAVDLGGTKIHAALCDLSGRILADRLEATDPGGGQRVVTQVGHLAKQLAGQLGLPASAIREAAIGSPGVADPSRGHIALAPNIAGLDGFDVAGALETALSCPVLIQNDVNMAAIGEQWRGCCQGIDDFVFVALGTGIGMGIVANGKLLRGAHGAAGEIALMPLGADPFAPESYPDGPLETAIGSRGILAYYHAQGGTAAMTVRQIFDEAERGGNIAGRTLDRTASILLQALMGVKALIDPARVVLGGSIGSRIELIDRVRDLAGKHGIAMDIVPSALGSRAGLDGAAGIAANDACNVLSAAPALTAGLA